MPRLRHFMIVCNEDSKHIRTSVIDPIEKASIVPNGYFIAFEQVRDFVAAGRVSFSSVGQKTLTAEHAEEGR